MLPSLKVLLVPLWIAAFAIIYLASRPAPLESTTAIADGLEIKGGQLQLAKAPNAPVDSATAACRYRSNLLAVGLLN